MRVTRDVETNRDAICRAIDFGVEAQADVVLTPEGSLSGYTRSFDQAAVAGALEVVTGRAAAAGVGLALGTCLVVEGGHVDNQIRFYDGDGTFLGCHSKILAGWLVKGGRAQESGDERDRQVAAPPRLRTFTLRGLTVGGLICNDLWANPRWTPMDDPHLTQQLSRLGAQVVLHAAYTSPREDESTNVGWQYHEANLRLRALAGNLWIVTVNNGHAPGVPGGAPSGVLRPDGRWAFQPPPGGEQCFAYTIEINE
jgi:predicted amidohydrolase